MSHPPPIWICAPDSFKGTLTAPEVAGALARGIRSVHPDHRILERPMADGGEGTVEAVARAQSGELVSVTTRAMTESGPPQQGIWFSSPDRAIVELAAVAGLTGAAFENTGPEARSTYPVGELVSAALDTGVSEIILAVGGSATLDGGLGLLQALGAVCTIDGRPLNRMCTAADLTRLDHLDLKPAQERLGRTKLCLAVDVQNPLCGPNGSARVYGPQKGARPEAIPGFEAGFRRLVELLGSPDEVSGDGAAGGVGYGLRAALGAKLIPGAALISELIGLPQACADASVVLTGEGCYDNQTQWGKVAWEVARVALATETRCALVAGQIRLAEQALQEDPFERHISLVDKGMCEGGMATEEHLTQAGAALAMTLLPH